MKSHQEGNKEPLKILNNMKKHYQDIIQMISMIKKKNQNN